MFETFWFPQNVIWTCVQSFKNLAHTYNDLVVNAFYLMGNHYDFNKNTVDSHRINLTGFEGLSRSETRKTLKKESLILQYPTFASLPVADRIRECWPPVRAMTLGHRAGTNYRLISRSTHIGSTDSSYLSTYIYLLIKSLLISDWVSICTLFHCLLLRSIYIEVYQYV